GGDEVSLRDEMVQREGEVGERVRDAAHEQTERVGADDLGEVVEDEVRRQRLVDERLVVREAVEVEAGEPPVALGHPARSTWRSSSSRCRRLPRPRGRTRTAPSPNP